MESATPSPEQLRFLMLYWFRVHGNATRATSEINDVFPGAVTIRTCQRWFQRFKSGDLSLEDKPRTGRPQEVSNDDLLEVVEENPRVTTDELAIMFDCSNSTIFEHLKSLGKKCKAG
uniref:Histone-lysine N-methyltransferase SETMAR-like n=1 Tax=Dermatophagoides pteronyssinus TaxID=6956 RepID=A0A6P6XYY2_DERPT